MGDEYTAKEKRQRAFDALSLEYSSLRSELTEKTTKNQQTTTLLVAAAGAVYALSSAKKDWADPLLVGLAIVLLLFAGVTWVASKQTVAKISAHVAAVEKQIDVLVDNGETTQPYMNWETQHQGRKGLSRLGMGRPVSGRYDPNR